MKSKKNLLAHSRLYLIIDRKACRDRSLDQIARRAAAGGVDLVQLRDKSSDTPRLLQDACALGAILRRRRIPLIINDHVDIAKIADSDGLHIGQSDISLRLARRILGPGKIIGVSCTTLRQALIAQRQGADYIGAGSVFQTTTKLDARLLRFSEIDRMRAHLRIPLFVLGGITMENLPGLVSGGIRRVAVCRSICCAKDIAARARYAKQLLLN